MFERLIKKIKPKHYWLLAYFLGSIAMFAMLSYSQRLSTGKYEMLSGDGFKLVANIRMFARSIWHGESIWYSFATSMGMNTALLIAYDCFSPFNIIYILFPKADSNVLTAIVFILKAGAAASAFQLFARRVLKQEGIVSVIFGIFYSMCGFSVFHCNCNNMWGDALYLLPLVGIGIYYAAYEGKFRFLTVVYTLAFITQFYTGYMIGVFSFLFFVLLLFVGNRNLLGKDKLVRFLRYFLSCLVSIMVSAIVWLPALYCLLHFSGEDATSFQKIGTTIFDLLAGMLWGRKGDAYSGLPYAYSGLVSAILLPFFFFSKGISKHTKWIAGGLLLFGLLCFLVMPFYSLIHAFDAPDGFNYRFLFSFSLIICSMGCLTIGSMEQIKVQWMVLWCAVLLLSKVGMMLFRNVRDEEDWKYTVLVLVINIVFMVIWFLLDRMRKQEKYRFISCVLCIFLAIGESASAGVFLWKEMDLTTENSYDRWDAYMRQLSKELGENQEKSFYRVVFQNDYHDNSDAFWGYNGITDFGSAENPTLRKMMHRLGFYTSPRLMHATGITPVTEMLLGIKYYYIGDNPFKPVGDSNPLVCNENPYFLGLGYVVDNEFGETVFESANGFETLNAVIYAMTGVRDVFTVVPKDRILIEEDGLRIAEKDGVTISVTDATKENPSVSVLVRPSGELPVYIQTEYTDAGYYNGLLYMYGMDNLMNDEGDLLDRDIQGAPLVKMSKDLNGNYAVRIECEDSSKCPVSFNSVNVYDFHEDVLEEAYNKLSEEQLIVEEWRNGYVKGRIKVTKDESLLFTTIPNIEGWAVWVDGKPQKTVPLMNEAFIGLIFPEQGEHTIEMIFTCPWLREGVVVSVIGLLLVVGLWVYDLRSAVKNA